MLQPYQPPKRWYRRGVYISIPIWPQWLAQLLCSHDDKKALAWGVGSNDQTTLWHCNDCYKSFSLPTSCKHPHDKWEVMCTETLPTAMGGGKHEVPQWWHCTDCGYPMRKDMPCPKCDTWMEIVGWDGLFSGRFYCPTCKVYYFREELENHG